MQVNNFAMKENVNVKFRVLAETLFPVPSVFTVEDIATNEIFNLTAMQIFKKNYIFNFSAQDIITITYCYAQEQFS